jgi:acylglycerol lipase
MTRVLRKLETVAESLIAMPNTPTLEEGPFAAADGTMLYRQSFLPTRDVCARLALLPGYGDHGMRYRQFLSQMAERGIAGHALDFRGQGKAGGQRAFVNRWDEYLQDAADFLEQDALRYPARTPLFLVAQSHGALVASVATIRRMLPEVAGCIFTAPYFRNRAATPLSKRLLAQAADRFAPHLPVRTDVPADHMTSDPEMQEEDRNDPLALGIATPRWFLTMQRAQEEALGAAKCFTAPLLILTGKEDQVSDNAATQTFFNAASASDKTLQTLSCCRHEPLRERNREETFNAIHAWICERIP